MYTCIYCSHVFKRFSFVIVVRKTYFRNVLFIYKIRIHVLQSFVNCKQTFKCIPCASVFEFLASVSPVGHCAMVNSRCSRVFLATCQSSLPRTWRSRPLCGGRFTVSCGRKFMFFNKYPFFSNKSAIYLTCCLCVYFTSLLFQPPSLHC